MAEEQLRLPVVSYRILGHDGASPTVWTKQAPATVPYGRLKAEATYLAGTGVVMFGGALANGQLLNETWVWSSGNWSQVSIANGASPEARIGHMMSSNTTQVIMFGGKGNNSQYNGTHKYTTSAGWVKLNPTGTPSVRSDGVMSWDSVNNVFIMFGGQDEYAFKTETYKFDPAANSGQGAWTQYSIANGAGPGGLIGPQMAFDTVSGKTILFGGLSATANYPSTTWSFDGALGVWTQL